ncbi:MAG TPA: exosortase [Pyrinomonadaceae bacterium]|nr:exosortase [Pyrinomonadaceae bacterium]
MSVPSPRFLWKPVAVAAALAFVYYSVLAKLGDTWWNDENYSHGLLIPAIIGYILWLERDRLARAVQKPAGIWGGLLVVAAILGLWVGTAGAELYIQRMSLVLMLVGVTVYFWGWRLLRLLAVPFGLLILAIPIPAIIFNKIAFPLQLFASKCAVWAMRLFDIPVLRQGNVIELMPKGGRETKRLEVVEACSGIRSLMTLLTLAVVFAYFTRPRGKGGDGDGGGRWLPNLKSYGFWRAAILVGSAVPIAILTNALRVSGTGVLSHYYGTEVADGFFHTFSGWVVYIVAFLLLFAVGWLLDKVGRRGSGDGDSGGGRSVATAKQAKVVKAEPAASTQTAPAGVIQAKGVE